VALADDAVEFSTQGLQVGDLAVDFRKMLLGYRVDRLAGALPIVGQIEKGPR
jgi:hypothetical protein